MQLQGLHSDGVFYRCADGGYPLFYVTADCGVLCADCVNTDGMPHLGCGAFDSTRCLQEDAQWCVRGADVNWEDPQLYCDNCSERIESAYAEDESEDESEADATEGVK